MTDVTADLLITLHAEVGMLVLGTAIVYSIVDDHTLDAEVCCPSCNESDVLANNLMGLTRGD